MAIVPTLPTATALVIIPPSSITNASGTPVDDTPTQIIIATSTPVLASAGAAVSPPIGPTAMKSHVTVTALSADVLQFQVTAPRTAEAVKLANAEATAYIAYINKTSSVSTGGVLPALQQQAARLSKQIQTLQSQINAASARLSGEGPVSATGQRDASLVGSLRTEQEEVALQLNNLNNEIVSTQLSGALSADATRLLQNAAIVPASKLQLASYPAIGAGAGLVTGCFLVFLRSRRDRRLRFRDELSSAVGVPVLASLESAECKSAKDWRRLVEGYVPTPVDLWNVRRVLHRVVFAEPHEAAQLNILVFANDGSALGVAVKLARSAADLGLQAELVTGPHPSMAPLRAACTVLARYAVDQPIVFEAKGRGPDLSPVKLTVLMVVVDDATPSIPTLGAASLLAVSSGFANSETLARVALAASEAGRAIDGIVMANPDPSDTTAGVVPLQGEPRQLGHFTLSRTTTLERSGQPR